MAAQLTGHASTAGCRDCFCPPAARHTCRTARWATADQARLFRQSCCLVETPPHCTLKASTLSDLRCVGAGAAAPRTTAPARRSGGRGHGPRGDHAQRAALPVAGSALPCRRRPRLHWQSARQCRDRGVEHCLRHNLPMPWRMPASFRPTRCMWWVRNTALRSRL